MSKIYTSYKCKRCRKEIILLTDEVESTKRSGKYLCCSHCGSKHIVREKETDDLRECMSERVYRRVNGSIRQVRND